MSRRKQRPCNCMQRFGKHPLPAAGSEWKGYCVRCGGKE